jgi:hypothetical protein
MVERCFWDGSMERLEWVVSGCTQHRKCVWWMQFRTIRAGESPFERQSLHTGRVRTAIAGWAAENGQWSRCPQVAGPFWVDSFAYYCDLLRSTRDFARQRVVRSPRSGPQIAWHRMHVPKNSFTAFFVTARGQGPRATDATYPGK